MQNNDSTPPKTVTFTLKVSHIRDIAIALACVAVGYSFLNKPVQPAPEPVSSTPAVNADTASSPPSIPKPEGSLNITGGKLTLGDDELSNKFRAYLNGRIKQVDAEGPVVLISAPQAQRAAAPQPPAENAAQQLARPSEPVSPVVREDINHADAAVSTDKGTFHPAPFTDKVAQASIDAISQQVVAKKGEGVVQIGRHLDGSIMTERETEEQIRRTLANLPDEWTITYKAPNEKVRLYVFTDTTCPFCHRLHSSMGELLNAGISVHYLLYPRDMGATQPGMLSKTAVNMKNIWCSVDQKSAMDEAFEGYKIPDADCTSLPASLKRWPAPVPDHFQVGRMYNVEATPTWLASNGKHDVGFSNAQTMIRAILGN